MSDHFEKAMQAIAVRSAENGGPTLQDILTALVATNDDLDEERTALAQLIDDNHAETRQLAARNLALIEEHLRDDVRMTNEEFGNFIGEFREEHERIDSELDTIKANCLQAHARQPRRKDDPPEVDYRNIAEDNEMGDIRRFWRVVKWAVAAAAIPLLVALGNELTHAIFGY